MGANRLLAKYLLKMNFLMISGGTGLHLLNVYSLILNSSCYVCFLSWLEVQLP